MRRLRLGSLCELKIVVGAVCRLDDRILLCRRAIEPRHGFWTIPAGFMEERESSEQAAREAMEEAHADIRIGNLLAVYNIPRISQVQLIYCAEMNAPEVKPGPESLEVRYFAWTIPWDELAFPERHPGTAAVPSGLEQSVLCRLHQPAGRDGRKHPRVSRGQASPP